MPGKKFWIGLFLAICTGIIIYLVLSHEKALVTQPKGMIAHRELHLIRTNILLMLSIVVPTLIAIFVIAWRYRAGNRGVEHRPKQSYDRWGQLFMWLAPSIIIVIMAYITIPYIFELDPYRPLESDVKPLKIEVMAIDWKWLFIYPDQGIATLNYVQFPEKTPINLSLAADGAPMNSFWIPQLSGQIYCMAGMITPLHIIADGPGVYRGKAAEINGDGYASMTFVAKSSTQEEFEAWVKQVQQSPLKLTHSEYEALLKPSKDDPVTYYSDVEKGLFHKNVMKYMAPNHHHHKS